MKLICVGTGSNGNCYLLECNGRFLVLDAGCKNKQVLIACDFKPSTIDAVLVTHVHGDHAKYIKDFRQDNIDVYTGCEQAKAISDMYCQKCNVIHPKRWNDINGNWKVLPFNVPHDGVYNFAYVIKSPDGSHVVLYATDFEYLPFTLKSFGINTWLIECNYSGELDASEHRNKLNHVLRGHSSLDTVKGIINANMNEHMKNILLCHLSANNADSSAILKELNEIIDSSKIKIDIAQQQKTYQL